MSTSKMVEAYDALRNRITSGALPPGTRLVNRSLASDLGVSTITVREALHRLASDGLVEHVPNAGAFVRRMDRESIVKLYEFRHVLESFAVREAVSRIRPRELERLRAICETWRGMARRIRELPGRSASAELLDEWIARDVEYHEILFAAADNPWFTRAVRNLRVMSRIAITKPRELSLGDAAHTLRSHVAIVRALERRDAATAERWMQVHNEVALDFVLRHMDPDTVAL